MATRDFVRIQDEVLSDVELLEVWQQFAEITIPAGSIFTDSAGLRKRASAGQFVEGLVYRLLHRELAYVGPQSRVEFWVNRSVEVTDTVDYHVDNNESLRARSGKVRMPATGAIFYAGPLQGDVGGTYFNPPLADAGNDQRLFTRPQFCDVQTKAGIAVPFRSNRLVVFDGRCPHCVIPYRSKGDKPRVTLLFNIWESGVTT